MRSYSNKSPASRRVVAAITTVFGAAADCSRAARFGVSPTTLRSCASPAPMSSPTTTRPVASPTRTLWPPSRGETLRDGPDQRERRAHGIFRVVFIRLGIAEIDQDAVAHIFGDIAAEPGDDVGRAGVVGGNDLAQILRIKPGGERGRADEIAEHHRDLAALGG